MTEKEWRHNRLVVLVTVVLAFSGFTMVVSFLPLYLQQLGVEDVALNALYSYDDIATRNGTFAPDRTLTGANTQLVGPLRVYLTE